VSYFRSVNVEGVCGSWCYGEHLDALSASSFVNQPVKRGLLLVFKGGHVSSPWLYAILPSSLTLSLF